MTQISMEAAFPTFQKKTVELFEANLLLQAQVDVYERELKTLREENERLKQNSPSRPPVRALTLPLRRHTGPATRTRRRAPRRTRGR